MLSRNQFKEIETIISNTEKIINALVYNENIHSFNETSESASVSPSRYYFGNKTKDIDITYTFDGHMIKFSSADLCDRHETENGEHRCICLSVEIKASSVYPYQLKLAVNCLMAGFVSMIEDFLNS